MQYKSFRYPFYFSVLILAALLWVALHSVIDAETMATITNEEIANVYNSIKNNDWQAAEKLCYEITQRDSPAQRYLIARLRYIYVFSIAAQIEQTSLSYKEVVRKLNPMKDKMILQPWHPIGTSSKSCLNQICVSEDNPNELTTIQTNSTGTTIYAFEYAHVGKPIDLTSFKGQIARLGGLLAGIDINPKIREAENSESQVSWFFRLNIKEGFIQLQR
jgi:hypothetical protein